MESSVSMREKMAKIENVSLETTGESAYLKPLRMKFTQNKRERSWDFLETHDSVAVVIFNRTREVLTFVRQFRPTVFFKNASAQYGAGPSDINWSQIPGSSGITLELCAGIMDKKHLSEQETAKEEVLEECGYDVPLNDFQFITKYLSGVGTTGSMTSLFYVEVEDHMKFNQGGGNLEEGELIEVVEMTIPEITDYVHQEQMQSTGGFAFAISWFLLNWKPKSSTG